MLENRTHRFISVISVLLVIFGFGLLGIVITEESSDEKDGLFPLTIKEIHNAYNSSHFTVEQLARNSLRLQVDSKLNAFTVVNPFVINEAVKLDHRRVGGKTLGALAGIPIIIKDSINVSGLPVTLAWAPLSAVAGGTEFIPTADATVVRRLREAGALIIGKGNTPVFSFSSESANNSWAGPTYNAFNEKFIPGGSSTGVATAVAAGIVVLGLAEETGGSIQDPAAAQGIVGVKPTFGLVPNSGAFPLSASFLDVIGPHARTVRDAAVMLDVIAGYDPADPKTETAIGNVPVNGYSEDLDQLTLKCARVGLYGEGWRPQGLSQETKELYQGAIKVIERLGAFSVADPFKDSTFANLVPKDSWKPYLYGMESFAYDLEQYLSETPSATTINSIDSLIQEVGQNPFDDEETKLGTFWKLANLEKLAKGRKQYLDLYSKPLGEEVYTIIDALPMPVLSDEGPSLSNSMAIREEYLNIFNRVFDDNDIDILVFPQTHSEISTMDAISANPSVSSPHVNILGLPVVTIPFGQYQSGVPFSIVFIGKQWSEKHLLSFAYSFEQSLINQAGISARDN